METFKAIHERASLKGSLSGRGVEPDGIEKLLEAARAAPSARNMQPWRFVVVTDRDVIDRLLGEAMKMPPDPAEYRFVIATPLSYPAQGSYAEAAQARLAQRSRKPLSEIAYRNGWGRRA
jgi:nitroreductase